jgi:DNA-binding XRE family transcriptional regulator
VVCLTRQTRLNRQQLAGAVGVHNQTIGYLERAEYSPSRASQNKRTDDSNC